MFGLIPFHEFCKSIFRSMDGGSPCEISEKSTVEKSHSSQLKEPSESLRKKSHLLSNLIMKRAKWLFVKEPLRKKELKDALLKSHLSD